MTDATFEEGGERPLRLIARDAEDLRVISALVQDAVLTGADLRLDPRRRRFSILLNRFRWESQAARGEVERVRAVLEFDDVRAARHQGLEARDADTVLALLAIAWEPADPEAEGEGPAGPGQLTLVFSGDGAIALEVECLEVQLCDMTRPYRAPSGRAPAHSIE
jgi:FAD/FMN-containing dehydrogenase